MPSKPSNTGKDKGKIISRCGSKGGSKGRKESIFCHVRGYESKGTESENLIKGGYIATTHEDSGWWDDERGVLVKDSISVETLQSWANDINSGNPRSNKVSVNHEREPHVTGVGIKDTAVVHQFDDGQYGLYVESLIDKTKENFADTEYRINNGLLDSYSIEYDTGLKTHGKYYPSAVREIEHESYVERHLLPGTLLEGWTLASRPMNENCVMIKEVKLAQDGDFTRKTSITEGHGHAWNTEDSLTSFNDDHAHPIDITGKLALPAKLNGHTHELLGFTENNKKEAQPKMVETKEDESKESPPAKVEIKEEPVAKEVKEQKVVEDKETAELIELGRKAKEAMLNEKKEEMLTNEVKELRERVLKGLKEDVIEEKIAINPDVTESKELVEFKEAMKTESKFGKNSMLKITGKMADSVGFTDKGHITGKSTPALSRVGSYKFDVKISEKKGECQKQMLEYKGLGITTNQNSDTDYLLSAAELSDVFDPLIFNMLNQATVTWNILPKDDFSNKGNNQAQFTGKTAVNPTAGAYTGDAITTGNVSRLKFMTKFKKYSVGVQVSGDMIAAARGGPIGDVFAREVADSTEDLLQKINQALDDEVGLETAAGVIGFEYITDSAGNTTLYNLTRSIADKTAPDNATDTYINGNGASITLANLRAAKRQALKEGARIENLVFICDHIQADKFRGVWDSVRRTDVPTSTRFGFEGRMAMDGIPIFEDKDINDDDWFLVDLETHRVAMWVPPTLEMLGKDSDAEKGFIKTYFATYNRAPRRMVQIYNNAT